MATLKFSSDKMSNSESGNSSAMVNPTPDLDSGSASADVPETIRATTTSLSTAFCLTSLPIEILTQIFTYVSTRAPSSQKILSEPQYDLTNSPIQPLKSLSLTSHLIRSIVLPLLFAHTRLDPYQLPSFLDFITSSTTFNGKLSRYVISATARLQGPCSHIQPTWWTSLLEALPNLDTLTVLAAPHVFAEVGQVSIDTTHSWAFKIPYHCMTLSYNPKVQARTKQVAENSKPTVKKLPLSSLSLTRDQMVATSDGAVQSSNNMITGRLAPQTRAIASTQSHVLLHHPWKTLSMNESSHLPAYSTYEYFLKPPPSLLTALYQQIQPQPQSLPPPMHTTILTFLHNLEKFSYTAIFPFYNHVDEILKLIRHMVRLKTLKMKLCPEPDSTVLQDELERNGSNIEGRATEGRIDVNDPWNEFEASYTLIPHTIIYLTTDGSLEEFQTDDVKMTGVRDTLINDIDRRLEGLGCWHHAGDGRWERDMKITVLPQNQQH